MRFLRRSLTGLFLLAMTVGLLSFAGKLIFDAVQDRMAREDRLRPARERILAVNVVTAEVTSVAPVLATFGEVASRRALDLRATTGGTLVELADDFEEGGRIEAGQLVARIDPTDAEAALALARTDLGEAEAALREAERALEIARDDLTSAEEQAALRAAALARATDLRNRGAGTAAAVETAELAASSSRQAVLSRRQALANAESQRDRAETALARQEISLAEAERNLAATAIHADFAGTLTEVTAIEGALVANNERLARLIDTDRLEVSFRVSTPQYARLLGPDGKLGAIEIKVALDVFGVGLETSARVTRESAAVGEGQTGRLLFAQIDEPRGLRPGDFVSVSITEPTLDRVAVLPAAALGADGTLLAIGPEDRLEAIAVDLLRRQGDDVIVRARGLDGMRIVAERTPALGPGIRVRPSEPRNLEQGAAVASAPGIAPAGDAEMIDLSEERRARLIAFVEGNQFMPADAKERILTQLKADRVPAQVVRRLEQRMGG